jgi:ribosomal protein S18 acetylase RimI-like enzyme
MTEVIFRSAGSSDVESVLALWELAAENAGRPADTAEALRRLIDQDADALILAVDGQAIVGSLIVGWDGWRGHLYRLAVRPDCRRRGIARDLLGMGETRLAGLGAGRADAMVLDGNRPAHGLWSAAGYRLQAHWSRWVKPLQR